MQILYDHILIVKNANNKEIYREFPGGPVVRTWHFHCPGSGSTPGWGTEIMHGVDQKKKKKYTKQNIKIILFFFFF